VCARLMSFSLSSRCRLARLCWGVVVCVEVVEDHSGESAFEATQGLGVGVAGGESAAVVGLSEALEADLSDGDAV
jgi:hypothetical protein